MVESVIALLHFLQLFVEEDVLVIRKRKTERHQSDHAQSDDDRHLLRDRRDFFVRGHGGQYNTVAGEISCCMMRA